MSCCPLLSYKCLNFCYILFSRCKKQKCIPHYFFHLTNFWLEKRKDEEDPIAKVLLTLLSLFFVPFFLFIDLTVYLGILILLLFQTVFYLLMIPVLLITILFDFLNIFLFWLMCCYFCYKDNMYYLAVDNLNWLKKIKSEDQKVPEPEISTTTEDKLDSPSV